MGQGDFQSLLNLGQRVALIDGAGAEDDIKGRCDQIRQQIEETTSD